MSDYDVVVVGTGTAASTVAYRVRAAGRRVAVIDHKPFGGTCALRGCDPKRLLMAGAEVRDAVRRMQPHGVDGSVEIAWRALMGFKRAFTDAVPEHRRAGFKEAGIDAFVGTARFTGPRALLVDTRPVAGGNVVIAAGAEPARLHIAGEELLASSEEFLNLDALPRHIVLVGGGYIAAEFSHLAARAGARVTIVQHGARMLGHFEPELVDWLMESFKMLGIEVITHASVKAVERHGHGYRVRIARGQQESQLDADLVVHSGGRVPALAALDLEAAGVRVERGRMVLNEFLQSVSNPAVYAGGDAAEQGLPLTPVAGHDGKVIAGNLLEGNRYRPDYRAVPSVAFTIPPIAAVGLTEAQARAQGLKVRVHAENVPDWFTARRVAEHIYGFKVLIDEATDHIVGAHLVGPSAEDTINLFALAMRHGLTTEQIKDTMFAYPTAASDVGYML